MLILRIAQALDNVDFRSFTEILTSHYRAAQGLWFHLENREKFISRNM